ncbi:MAG: hypothetical protein KME11_03115 [Timaviella obliquedivisa GSE-PSE-MK23-08B]|jgi:hypothetical protein|nr:hypothetical protein [Timaviella obliquedivisa GSE-PSE-MK23-08B]MBW4514198.1 hypothetical protein [Timaviella obliquedivisa GSE-PSE-MK23-08B]
MPIAQCPRAVTARVTYDYLDNGIEYSPTGVIVSNEPGVIVSKIKLNDEGGNVNCRLYTLEIVVGQYSRTEPMQLGQRVDLFNDYIVEATVYGPIGEARIINVPTSNGTRQKIELFCRAPFGYFSGGCFTPDFYEIGILAGTRNNAHFLDPDNIRVQAIRYFTNPVPPCRFVVLDGTGYIYDRTESVCPSTTVTCEGTCLPGGARIGGCCVDCSDLTENLEAIRQAMRRL